MGLIVRLLLIIGGAIAGLFATQGTYHYSIYQMIFGILVMAALIAGVAFGPALWRWIKGKGEDESSQ